MVARKVKAKFCDFTSDATIVIFGRDGEHLIVELEPAHVVSLESGVNRYADYHKIKEGVPLEP